MYRQFCYVLLCLFFTALNGYGKPLEIEVSGESAILINAETGAVLFEKNAHVSQYPASVTKAATALYALKQAGNDLDEMVEADKEAIASITPSKKKKAQYRNPPYWIEVGSTHIAIKKGETLPLRALMYGVLIASANDAANIVAQHVGGTIPGFVTQLNEYLKQIGCQETHFVNPHGLHHPDHVTSAADIAIFCKEAMKIPQFRDIVSTVTFLIPESNKQARRTLVQTNRLLKKSSASYYKQAIGIKNGYTSDALYTLAAAANNGERSLIAVVLRCPECKDTYRDVINMFDTAFNEPQGSKRLLKKGPQPQSLEIKGGASQLVPYLSEDVTMTYFASEEPVIRATLKWEELTPPIAKDQKVGTIQLASADGTFEKTATLYASGEIKPTYFFSMKQKLKKWGQSDVLVTVSWIFGSLFLLSGLGAWYYFKKTP